MWCQIFTEVDLKSISWISALEKRRRLDAPEDELEPRVEFSQRMHFLISIFLCEYEKSALFSPDLAVTWEVLSKISLSIRVHALWMCYNEQSLYLYLKKKQKKTAQGYWKPSKGLVHLNLVCNQFDVALTSMYTKVLTEWGRSKTLYQMAKEHVTVFSTSCYHFIRHNLSPSGNVSQREKSNVAPFAPDVHDWAQMFQCHARFQTISTLLMQTLH